MHPLHSRIFNKRYMANMDQANVYFDYAPHTTVHIKGEHTFSVKIGGSSSRLTLCVAVVMDGTKVPHLVVMNGRPSGRIEKNVT